MRRYINMTCRKAVALLVLAAMLLLPVTPALAAEATDKGLDAVDIAADGTVTLISGHMAGEGIASVQLVLEGVGNAGFEFAVGRGDHITKAIPHDGELHIYVAGAGPLMGPGVTSIVLGWLTSGADTAKLKEGSLQYVYGQTVMMQNVTNEYNIDPGDGTVDSAYSELEKLVTQADAIGEGQKENYTDESWAALLTALDSARQLLDQEYPKEEAALAAYITELEKAYERLEDAIEQLTPVGKVGLINALEQAQARLATIDRTKYTPESIAALEKAVADAIAVRDNKQSTQADWDAAVAAIEAAALVEIPQQTDDPSGGGGSGSGGSGGGTADPDPSDTTEPSAGPTATSPTVTPTATAAAKTAPNTGDETLIVPWLALLALCGGMLILLTARRRQER